MSDFENGKNPSESYGAEENLRSRRRPSASRSPNDDVRFRNPRSDHALDELAHPRISPSEIRTSTPTNALRRISTLPSDGAGDPVIYTKSETETLKYLETHGIDICKNPEIIEKDMDGQELEYEQRVCIRYLQPPPAPQGTVTVEEIRQPVSLAPPVRIHEQGVVVATEAPIILRERPPRPPAAVHERKTVVVPSGTDNRRSVVIERYPTLGAKPRDVIIEKWLPYGPPPEPKVIVKRSNAHVESARPTCTIVKYRNANMRVTRRFVIVDVENADPEDYVARNKQSLLDSHDLVQEVVRAGIVEDITSPVSISKTRHVQRKSIDYRDSKYIVCECFSSDPDCVDTSEPSKYGNRSSHFGEENSSRTFNRIRREEREDS